jgi:hypothetical protein
MLDNQGYRHTLRICNTYCFCQVNIATSKQLGVTLYVHFLPCCFLNPTSPCLLHAYKFVKSTWLVASLFTFSPVSHNFFSWIQVASFSTLFLIIRPVWCVMTCVTVWCVMTRVTVWRVMTRVTVWCVMTCVTVWCVMTCVTFYKKDKNVFNSVYFNVYIFI